MSSVPDCSHFDISIIFVHVSPSFRIDFMFSHASVRFTMIAFNRRQRAGSDDVSDDGGNGGEFDIYN